MKMIISISMMTRMRISVFSQILIRKDERGDHFDSYKDENVTALQQILIRKEERRGSLRALLSHHLDCLNVFLHIAFYEGLCLHWLHWLDF